MQIYEFDDYQQFLRAYIERLPKSGHGEINRMATAMQVHASLVSQILSGKKNLSLEQAQLCCEYLGLTKQETEYFFALLQRQRAGTIKLRQYFSEQVRRLKDASIELSKQVRQDKEISEEEKSIFYSHWHYAAVWLLTSLGAGKTIDEVARHFEMTKERSSAILHFLASVGLCRLVDGRFVMSSQSIHLQRGSPHLSRHHANWRLRAIEASDHVMDDELIYTAPFSVSRADLKKLRKEFVEVIKRLADVAIESKAEETVCVNIDLFRIRK